MLHMAAVINVLISMSQSAFTPYNSHTHSRVMLHISNTQHCNVIQLMLRVYTYSDHIVYSKCPSKAIQSKTNSFYSHFCTHGGLLK